MTDGRRLNVALTRQEDASIILYDVPAIDNAKSEPRRNVQATEEAPPPEAEPNVEIAEDSMDPFGKLQTLSSFLKAQKCIIDVDIATITEVGTSHEEALELKRTLDEFKESQHSKQDASAKPSGEVDANVEPVQEGTEDKSTEQPWEGHVADQDLKIVW